MDKVTVMSIIETLVGIMIVLSITMWILFLIFSQTTVRKLKNNPDTKDKLGIEFISGWNIFNIAQALALPKSWSNKLENSPLDLLHSDSELLFKNTNKWDRLLAITFWYFFIFTGAFGISIVIVSFLGIFD